MYLSYSANGFSATSVEAYYDDEDDEDEEQFEVVGGGRDVGHSSFLTSRKSHHNKKLFHAQVALFYSFSKEYRGQGS